MTVDYIIVGIGLAGISFCEQLRANNKSFIVFDNCSQQSSTVAGGLYNPVVLKRFTPVWKSNEQLDVALPMYKNIETRLGVVLDYKMSVYRKFASTEEQNNWFSSSDHPILSDYLSPHIINNDNQYVNASFGFGKVLRTGRIDVNNLIDSYKKELAISNKLIHAPFSYDDLIIGGTSFTYHDITSKHIVFSEGFGLVKNPFFNTLPLSPTKGELLIIYAPDLKIDFVLKSSVFLIPLGSNKYIVGATYDWKDTSQVVTEQAKISLLSKLDTLISCSYEVLNQLAGIRPTVKDRRPLIGEHKIHKKMYVLNGLGTRGVMIGPYVAKQLYDFIAYGIPLEPNIDIKRFNKS